MHKLFDTLGQGAEYRKTIAVSNVVFSTLLVDSVSSLLLNTQARVLFYLCLTREFACYTTFVEHASSRVNFLVSNT
jgi:hypothetical protein